MATTLPVDSAKREDGDRSVNKSSGSTSSRDEAYHMIPIDRNRTDIEHGAAEKSMDNDQQSKVKSVNEKKDPRQPIVSLEDGKGLKPTEEPKADSLDQDASQGSIAESIEHDV